MAFQPGTSISNGKVDASFGALPTQPLAAAVPLTALAAYGHPEQAETVALPLGSVRRYGWPSASPNPVALYVISTTGGELGLVCAAQPYGAAVGACTQLAEHLSLKRASLEYPGPEPAVAAGLRRQCAGACWSSFILGTRGRYGDAPSSRVPMLALAAADRRAAAAIAGIKSSPRYQTKLKALGAATVAEAKASEALAAAARAHHASGWETARSSFVAADLELGAARRELAIAGFTISAEAMTIPPAPRSTVKLVRKRQAAAWRLVRPVSGVAAAVLARLVHQERVRAPVRAPVLASVRAPARAPAPARARARARARGADKWWKSNENPCDTGEPGRSASGLGAFGN